MIMIPVIYYSNVFNILQKCIFGTVKRFLMCVFVLKLGLSFRVLVGAPEAQSQFHRPEQVDKGGAVYKCRPDADNSCQEIPFDREGKIFYGQCLIANQHKFC